jgi:hypothetical protein
MFQKANYSFLWSATGAPVVQIDLADEYPAAYTESSLAKIIEKVRRMRKSYPTEAEYQAALGVFEGALKYLRTELDVEQRR